MPPTPPASRVVPPRPASLDPAGLPPPSATPAAETALAETTPGFVGQQETADGTVVEVPIIRAEGAVHPLLADDQRLPDDMDFGITAVEFLHLLLRRPQQRSWIETAQGMCSIMEALRIPTLVEWRGDRYVVTAPEPADGNP